MINAIILKTNGQAENYTFDSLKWSDCVKKMGGMPANTKATLVRVGGTTMGRNLVLSEDSVLPAGGTSYLIAFTQDKMSGASFEYSKKEIRKMSHRELIGVCKKLRSLKNEELNKIVGNYTVEKTDSLKEKLYKAIDFINSQENNDSDFVKRNEFEELKERVLQIESYLVIPSEEFLEFISK